MRRRGFLQFLAGMLGTAATFARFSPAAAATRVRPGTPGWPADAAWKALGQAVHGRLEPVRVPALRGAAADGLLANPFYLGNQAGLTQSAGWVDAWRSAPSAYVVNAINAMDVAKAVQFARTHRLRLVVKGGGHSYLGGSNGPDSLLIWTRGLDTIVLHDDFVPQGCATAPLPAVSVGAGCVWLHVYDAVTTTGGRYVQGGGCTSVGVAGLVLGGGFGSYSKAFGLAAASLLEAEIVTADGVVRTVNACREPDLFWVLKGGGGGTFGVVTRLTLRTHDLPATFGAVRWTIVAASDEAYRRLLGQFVACYAENMFNPHWGEQVQARADNRLIITMVFQGLGEADARAAWDNLARFVADHSADYTIELPLRVFAFPARMQWNEPALHKYAPAAIHVDDRPGAAAGDYWWAGDGEQAGTLWHGYHSAWLPAGLLQQKRQSRLVDAWFEASRHWSVSFHFNKGLAGATGPVIAASADSAMNPDVLGAFALGLIAGSGPPNADIAVARANAARIAAAMQALRKAAIGTGSYLSESDFFNPDWPRQSWGAHWEKLSRVKRAYDPDGLFTVHHGVGSEAWSSDGFTKLVAK